MELLGGLFEYLLSLVIDIALNGLIELLIDAGLRIGRLGAEPKSGEAFAVRKSLRWLFLGWVLGALSFLFRPAHFIPFPLLRTFALVLSPALCGFLMMKLGRAMENKNRPRSSLEHFGPSFCFAFGLGSVRYFLCH